MFMSICEKARTGLLASIALCASVAVLASGCAAESGTTESNSLGITEIQVERSPSRLTIVGRDARHDRIAGITVQLGDVVVEDFGPAPVSGRSIQMDVRGSVLSHRSKGLSRLALPLPSTTPEQAEFVAFLLDPRVEAELSAWDIGFVVVGPQSSASDGEEAALAACTFARNTSCGANRCGEYGGSPNIYENVCCDGSSQAVNRLCTGIPLNAGGTAPNTNGCGAVGPKGCAVCTVADAYTYCALSTDGTGMWHDGMPSNCGQQGAYCTTSASCCLSACTNYRCGPSGL